jgi:DNA repair ATPase RecN
MEEMYQESEDFFQDHMSELDYLSEKVSTATMFSESVDVYEESVKDAITSIGKKIIEIVDRCIKFIQEKIGQFTHYMWTLKDEEKVLRQLEKKRPDIASQVRAAVKEDKIKLNNFRDLSSFYREIDNTLNEIDKMDAKSARARMAKAGKALDKSADVIIKVGAVATAAVAMNKFKKTFIESGSDDKTVSISFKNVLEFMSKNGKKDNELSQMQEASKKMGDKLKKASKDSSLIKESVELSPENMKKIRNRESVLTILTTQYEKVTNAVITKRIKGNMTMFGIANKMKNQFKGVEI